MSEVRGRGEGSDGDVHDLVVVQVQRPQVGQRLQRLRGDRVDHVVSPATDGGNHSHVFVIYRWGRV